MQLISADVQVSLLNEQSAVRYPNPAVVESVAPGSIGEELGFVFGTVPVLTLFLLIFFRGLKVAKECTDPFGVFLAVGISFNLILYAFVNAAVVTGIFPVTGLPMPMVSYGGSGMVINMGMIGILLNISQARRSVGGNRGWSPVLYG